MVAARDALSDIARELGTPRGRYPAPGRSTGLTTQPRPLDLAVLAVRVSQALELVAAEEIERARQLEGTTWEEVGEAFGVSMQSAYSRFRQRS
ncbi:MAG: hypothetical protein ABI658_31235 [Acidimicrobiales bacterium]